MKPDGFYFLNKDHMMCVGKLLVKRDERKQANFQRVFEIIRKIGLEIMKDEDVEIDDKI